MPVHSFPLQALSKRTGHDHSEAPPASCHLHQRVVDGLIKPHKNVHALVGTEYGLVGTGELVAEVLLTPPFHQAAQQVSKPRGASVFCTTLLEK